MPTVLTEAVLIAEPLSETNHQITTKTHDRVRRFAGASSNTSCSMVSRSSSTSRRVAALICITRLTGDSLIDLYGFFGSMPIGFNHPYFDHEDVKRDLLRAAQSQDRKLGCLLGRLRRICRNVLARRWFAAARALSVHRGRRARGRELLEGRDGLEGAQKLCGRSRRNRHRCFAFS